MQTKPKANSIITHSLEMVGANPVLTFHVKGAGDIRLDMGRVHADVFTRAAIHGMIQRISDAAAISRDPETGRAASAQEKFESMQALAAHYLTGTSEWSRVQSAGPRGGVLFKALCRMFEGQKSAEEVRAWLDGKTKAEQAALRANAKVKAHIDAIEAELGKASDIDAEALIDELAE